MAEKVSFIVAAGTCLCIYFDFLYSYLILLKIDLPVYDYLFVLFELIEFFYIKNISVFIL